MAPKEEVGPGVGGAKSSFRHLEVSVGLTRVMQQSMFLFQRGYKVCLNW